jgi:hypothetical protein
MTSFIPKLYFSPALWTEGLMHVRKVSSQISLWIPHRLIRDNIYHFYDVFRFKEVRS